MNKLEKLDYIKKVCGKNNITAYRIETGLTSVGIQNIKWRNK
jgi:hypothetical protein